jgi:hypothetical protein
MHSLQTAAQFALQLNMLGTPCCDNTNTPRAYAGPAGCQLAATGGSILAAS